MTIIVPMWFYEFGSVMYFFAALIGLLLSYFSFKLYNFTRKRQHLLLNLSFVFITIGFIILAASNIYSILHFERCEPNCTITQQHLSWILYGNYSYYITSAVGYLLFLLSYPIFKKKERKKLFLQIAPIFTFNVLFLQPIYVLYPFENAYFQPFHLLSAILLFLIVIQTFGNYRKTKAKTRVAALVPIGFAAILFYHVLMFSIPFSPLFFAFAHLSLLIGFTSLLLMLVKVTRR
jgi:hypothetical protein